jgi:hypothetical protein
MLIYALGVFAVAALGGLFLASQGLTRKEIPWIVSIFHALLGAMGLVLGGFAIFEGEGGNLAKVGLALLVVTALGGFLTASFHLRKVLTPKALFFIHGGAAVAGFLCLAAGAFNLFPN